MSLEKAIKHKKEKRQPYRGSKRFDKSCRNHGSCPYCLAARTHNGKKRKLAAEEHVRSFLLEG